MGFWDVAKNMLAGKPAFEVPKETSNEAWESDAPTTDYNDEIAAKKEELKGLYNSHGVKHIPEAGVIHTKYHVNGDHVQVWVTIKNLSDRVLELDKFSLCGQRYELDYPLQPHGEREFSVYRGPAMTHSHYSEAELYYKDVETGDYFMARHNVHYHFERNNTYNPQSIELIHPIKDI